MVPLSVLSYAAKGINRSSCLWVLTSAELLAFHNRNTAPEKHSLERGASLRDIAYGSGKLWCIEEDASGTRHLVSFRVNRPKRELEWTFARDVRPVRLAAIPSGGVWVVSEAGEAWRFDSNGSGVRVLPSGAVEEISVGADGQVWVVSREHRFGGRVVRRFLQTESAWYSLPPPASAVKIAGAPDGMAWTVNSKGDVWMLHPLGGGNFPYCEVDTACERCRFSSVENPVDDIAVGPDGCVWITRPQRQGVGSTISYIESGDRKTYVDVGEVEDVVGLAAGTLN
jgi:hypothetical protein